MSITLSSTLTFPFRGGRGINQSQIWWNGAIPVIDGTVYEDTATSLDLDTDAKLNKLYILESTANVTVNITVSVDQFRILQFVVPEGAGITGIIQQGGVEVTRVDEGESVTLIFDPNELTEWLVVQDAGKPGPTGARGPAGADGMDGATGPAGADGMDGATGPRGNTGAQGPMGARGATGAQGPTGATGAQGPAGADGAPGAPGAKGDPGTPGAPGATGPAGADGAQGPAGPGVPNGGTTGQVLTKASNTDQDTEWTDAETEAPEGSLVWPGLADPGHIIWPNVGS